jgi:hypothetical protein
MPSPHMFEAWPLAVVAFAQMEFRQFSNSVPEYGATSPFNDYARDTFPSIASVLPSVDSRGASHG